LLNGCKALGCTGEIDSNLAAVCDGSALAVELETKMSSAVQLMPMVGCTLAVFDARICHVPAARLLNVMVVVAAIVLGDTGCCSPLTINLSHNHKQEREMWSV